MLPSERRRISDAEASRRGETYSAIVLLMEKAARDRVRRAAPQTECRATVDRFPPSAAPGCTQDDIREQPAAGTTHRLFNNVPIPRCGIQFNRPTRFGDRAAAPSLHPHDA